MIEQNIEDAVIAKIDGVLRQAGIENFQLAGQLQATDGVKGLEQANADVIIIAKSSPRSYSTPTIPTCQIDIQLSVLVRADIDFNGMKYLDITDKIMNTLQHWQRCMEDTHEDFTVLNEFECTGFQLGSGTFTLDASGKVWQYQHNMTVYGVVQEISQ